MKYKLIFQHNNFGYRWNDIIYANNRREAWQQAHKIASTTNSTLKALYQQEQHECNPITKGAFAYLITKRILKPFRL